MARTIQTKSTVTLKDLVRLGPFRVELEGECHPAPFSKKDCIRSDWIYNDGDLSSDQGFHSGESREGRFVAKTRSGTLEIDGHRILPYVGASFQGPMIRDGDEVVVTEYCLEPDRRYYALVETSIHTLPGFRVIPFWRRRTTVLRLALSDRAFVDGRPGRPLVPTFRGMTWEGRDSSF